MMSFFFLLGIIVGSFLNVVVLRTQRGESFVFGRSHCSRCRHELAWYDNIPLLSFIFLRGRCRFCGDKISRQYPLVELLTGALFVVIGNIFFLESQRNFVEGIWMFLLVGCLISIAVYDFLSMEIPVSFLWSTGLVAFLGKLALEWHGDWLGFLLSVMPHVLGGVLVGGFFFLLVWISKETWMGWGDVWLGGISGFLVGLPLVLPFLSLAFGIGALTGIGLLIGKKKGMKSALPFGPFLCFATFVILIGEYYNAEILRPFLFL